MSLDIKKLKRLIQIRAESDSVKTKLSADCELSHYLTNNAHEILAVLEAAYHPADVLQGEVVCCQCGEHPEHPIHTQR